MNTNLLDLDIDILNIIGDYVKQDDADRMEKEEDFKYADEGMNFLKKKKVLTKK